MELENRKWTEVKFLKMRQLILSQMPMENHTGYKQQNKGSNFTFCLKYADKNKETLIQSNIDNESTETSADLVSVSGKQLSYKIVKDKPWQVSLDRENNKTLSEKALSIGVTSFLGGAVSQCLFHKSNITLGEALIDWQYCDRLSGFVEERGLAINREFLVPAVTFPVPPGYSNALTLMEAILAVEQGVKSITLGYRASGNLIQDAAALTALREQSLEYFNYLGFRDLFTTIAFYGIKHNNIDKACAISESSYIATVSVLTNTIKLGINESYLEDALKTASATVNFLKNQKFPWCSELEVETAAIKLESKLIMDKINKLGCGDLAVGLLTAYKEGLLDIFSAKIIKNRDSSVRYLNFGNIPANYELKCYNKKKLKENY